MSCFGPGFHICRFGSLPVQPESFLCSHLLVHFLSRLTDLSLNNLQYRFLGRSSRRLPCFGPDLDVYRCMSLPIQPESFGCGHLLVHFGSSYRSMHKLAEKTNFGEIQSLAMLRTRPSRSQEQVSARTAGVISVRPPARAFCLVLQIHP